MTFKTAYIQQPAPAKRGSRSGDFASDLAALGLHSCEHGFNRGRDRNAKGFTSSALGAGEGKHTVFQIHAIKGDLRLTETATCSQGNFKADSHPFRHTLHGQSLPRDFNFIIRKDRFDAVDRPPLNSVIQKGDRIHLSKQSALAVNPLQQLQIRARLVATSLAARRSGKALSPLQINFTIGWRKTLTGYFFLTNKSRQMTPAIPIVHFCQRGNGMILDQIINPVVAVIRSLFVHAKSSSLGRCLCAMQGIVDSVAGAFATPFSCRVFKTNKEPRAAAFLVRIRHSHNGNIRSV